MFWKKKEEHKILNIEERGIDFEKQEKYEYVQNTIEKLPETTKQ